MCDSTGRNQRGHWSYHVAVLRHCDFGLSWITVSIMEKGAGLVDVSARPDFPSTLATSGKSIRMRSCVCISRCISVTEAQRLMQTQDRILMDFPEVASVLGKSGRAETSTNPAPFSMMETAIQLKPKSQWRKTATWYDQWPRWLRPVLSHVSPDHISTDQLSAEMDQALQTPAVSNAWTVPIKNRIDMLTTGVRTPVGIKVYGPDLAIIERIGKEIEAVLPDVAGT